MERVQKSASEVFEAALETGLGLAAVSTEWLGHFIEQVSPKLAPTRERGARLIEELREKGREKRPEIGKFACGAVDWVKERSGLTRSAEIQALKDKVARLEQELERLKAGGCA